MPYSDPAHHISHLYVERSCLELPLARQIVKRSGLPVVRVDDDCTPVIEGPYPDNLTRGKRHLLLCRNKGRFFKPCPGTSAYRCCGYHVLNIGMNCPMDCVYCILQAYLNNPWLSFFVNTDDLFRELDLELNTHPEEFYRVGTGEFTDSLALDRLTGLSRLLVGYFRNKDNAVLELKTKSDVIDNLLDLEHGGRTVLSWSMNAPQVMQKEEIRTASLEQRLKAARRCADKGYLLAFHFDPIIYHPHWREGYSSTIKKLFQAVPADRIVWISLGALRYIPRLKTIAADRFPGSKFFYHEFVEGLDGKSRYFRDQRVEMYTHLVGELSKYVDARTCMYFCMENDLIWQQVFGYRPEERGGLSVMLNRAVGWSA